MTENLETEIERVSNLWNDWIEQNGVESIKDRKEGIQREIEKLINVLASSDLKENVKILYHAKLLTVIPEYSAKAKEMLEKVVKKDPANFEAWNLLGEQFWRQGPKYILEAKRCFEGSLSQNKNSRALGRLSMLLRALPVQDAKQRSENIQQSLAKAREAVDIDKSDGDSWYVLGNAYLTIFFTPSKERENYLNLSLEAYKNAESNGEKYNPDLHYNRALLQLFSESWEDAYQSLILSAQLDPEWTLPTEKYKNILSFCRQVVQLCKNKGKMRPKRLNQLVQKCEQNGNEMKDVLCVASLSNFDYLPFAFIGVDKELKSFLITVYNMVPGKGPIIGDIISIPKPIEKDLNFELNSEKFEFVSIRTDRPSLLKINSRIWGTKSEVFIQSHAENRL